MTERESDLSGIYRFTSMARPIDPAYLSNRALLIVLPLLALVSAGLASIHVMSSGPLSAAFSGALAGFAAWALTRELAPDYDGAAFVALTLAWFGNVAFGVHKVLLLFVALVLVRVVNRSTGIASRPFDTLAVFGFCTWAALSMQQPLILVIASAAFSLDASLKDSLRHHYLAAAACLSVFVWMLLGDIALLSGALTARDSVSIVMAAVGIILVVNQWPAPISYCDTAPERLDRVRVNAGLLVGFLIAVQALLTEGRSAWLETPIWACIVAVLVSFVLRHAKRQRKTMLAG